MDPTDRTATAWLCGRRARAVLFDMDGVVTDTASLHTRAWRLLFDDVLSAWGQSGLSDAEYAKHLDGRARVDGVAALLRARGIDLPTGGAQDSPSDVTVSGLARHKDALFQELLRAEGAAPCHGVVDLLHRLETVGVLTGLVTASKNAERVLASAGLAELFHIRVDGVTAERFDLPGKPAPGMYLAAARQLRADPADTVVVEDAVAGIEAAVAGGFGLVVGVAAAARRAVELRAAGADLVVGDLTELTLETAERDCALCARTCDEWALEYLSLDPDQEGTRESLLSLGNGYLATRGAVPESTADGTHYPGTYAAGVFNRLVSRVAGQVREDESMVNLPNWLPLTFRIDGSEPYTPGGADVLHHHRLLDLRRGVLHREIVLRDGDGRQTRLRQRCLVSMAQPHRAGLETVIIAENWSGRVELHSRLDAGVRNTNVAEFAGLANRHLLLDETGAGDSGTVWLAADTSQSAIRVALAERVTILRGQDTVPAERAVTRDDTGIGQVFGFTLTQGEPVTVEKSVVLYTSRDRAISEPLLAAREDLATGAAIAELIVAHEAAWRPLWHRFHMVLAAREATRRAVNVHLFHLLQTLSAHTMELDAGVPARGLHGEGYRGHVFWDELFVFPILNLRLPELTRSLLLYRYRRLPQARALAAALGARGAQFPWQSGSDGREETPRAFYNPRSGRWMTDNSRRQYHVGLAVAYNVWHYWETTADLGFLIAYGVELLIETARFFASIATYDSAADRYDIRGVMGPDEFHDGYPDRPGEGIDNSAYVNIMTAWTLVRAVRGYRIVGQHDDEVVHRLGVTDAELEIWTDISRRLRLPLLGNGLLAQFEGYDQLAELDWDAYRARYGDVGRLDLILEAEDDSTNRYQVGKQADVLMLLYLFSAEELTELVTGLGYHFDPARIPEVARHYLARTTHGSTLSHVAHSWVLARGNRAGSWRMLLDALAADLADTQGGTTREGIHLGAMAGTLDILQRCYTGLDIRDGALWIHPTLPDELAELEYQIRYRGHRLLVRIDHDAVTVRARAGAAAPVTVRIHDERIELGAGMTRRVAHQRDQRPPRRRSDAPAVLDEDRRPWTA